PVEVLVNSGIYYGGGMQPFADTPIDEYQKAFTANVIAPLHLVQQVLPSMRQLGGGLVVNISSGAGQNETRDLPGAGGGRCCTRSPRPPSTAPRPVWPRSCGATAWPS